MNRTRYSRGSQFIWLLSLLVVVSMVVGTVLSVLPRPEVRATPTAPRPTSTATLAVSQVTPTP